MNTQNIAADFADFNLLSADDSAIRKYSQALADHFYENADEDADSFVDPITGVEVDGYSRSIDDTAWARRLRKRQLIATADETRYEIGGNTGKQFASERSRELYRARVARQESYIKNAFAVKLSTSDDEKPSATRLEALVPDERRKFSRTYAFTKAVASIAADAGYDFIMLTATLEPQLHINPVSKHKPGKTTAKQGFELLKERRHIFRRALDDYGLKALGFSKVEPHEDGTVHFHIALAVNDSTYQTVLNCALHAFGGGRIGIIATDYSRDESKTTYHQYSSNRFFQLREKTFKKRGYRLTITRATGIGSVEQKIKSVMAYLAPYLASASGHELASKKSKKKFVDTEGMRAHKAALGVQDFQFWGLPSGTFSLWDICRSLEVQSDMPWLLQDLISAATADVGENPNKPTADVGVKTFIELLGGLSIFAPRSIELGTRWLEARVGYIDAVNKYGEQTKKQAGVELFDCQIIRKAFYRSKGKRYYKTVKHSDSVYAYFKQDEYALALGGDDASALIDHQSSETDLTSHSSVATESAPPVWSQVPAGASALVQASAGSGKTYALTERARFLLDSGIQSSKIVATTFTRFSASDLSTRFSAAGVSGVFATTLHKLAFDLLRKAGGAVDFDFNYDNIIASASKLPSARLHFLVDECQDLSPDQLAFIDRHAVSIFAVGDEHQSLYTWRNADSAAMRKLREIIRSRESQKTLFSDFDIDQVLDINRRSSSAVVSLANKISGRSVKAMRFGGSSVLYGARTEADYIDSIVSRAHAAAESGSVFILTRNNAHRIRLRLALKVAGVSGARVLTIHAAKGLEADRVIFATHLPSSFGNDDAIALRNLAYVAVTRARESVEIVSFGKLESRLKNLIHQNEIISNEPVKLAA